MDENEVQDSTFEIFQDDSDSLENAYRQFCYPASTSKI